MARKDDILRSVMKHEILNDKYQLSDNDIPDSVKSALKSSVPIIKCIALIIDNLENATPTTDPVLRNIITQYLNESAL